jgi:DNA invertase Pin-like site-specific DNA recombinase
MRNRDAVLCISARHGDKPSIDAAKIKKMKDDGMGASSIAKALKIGRASVYRALAD